MTNAESRHALAAAANEVDGVHCTPYVRQTTKPGDAFVRLDRMVRDANGFGYVNTWQIWLVAPQTVAAAEQYVDAKLPALLAALSSEMVVTTVTPGKLALDTDTVLGVSIEGTRED